MIAFVTKGYSFRGSVEYDFSPCKITGKPRAEYVGGTLCGTPRQMAEQVAPFRALRDVTNPVWRVSLNADTADGVLSLQKWDEISNFFLTEMGLATKTAAWCSVRHTDHHHDPVAPRDGVHISVIRVQADGSLFNVENDVFRAIQVTKKIEEKFGLKLHRRERAERRAPTNAQIRAKKRIGKMASQQTIQNKVDQVFSEEKNNLSFPTLKEKLRLKRIGIKPKISNEGRLMGFSYEDFSTGVKIPGSKLGTDFSLGLLTRGLKFGPKEVLEELEEQKLKEQKPKPASKMPAMLKPLILPQQYGAKEIRPLAAHQTEVTLSPEKYNSQVVNLQIGPASKVMLLLGGLLAQASVFLIQKILAFLKRLLQAFGFGIRQSDIQKHTHTDPNAPALCYEPTQLSLPAPKSAEDQVANELFRVVEALEQNDPSLLPVILGAEKEREAVQAAMLAADDNEGRAGVATGTETDDFGFSDSDFVSADSSLIDPMEVLKVALKASQMAQFSLEKAERKNVPLHIDTSDVEEKYHSQVKNALSEAKEDFVSWKKSNFFDANNPFSSAKAEREAQIKSLEKYEKEATADYEEAVAKTKKYAQLLKDAPAPIVPGAVKDAAENARKALLDARLAVHNQAILMVEALKRDPKLLMQAGVFEFELTKSLKEFHNSLKISVAAMTTLESQWTELRKLKKLQVESGFVPSVASDFEMPDTEFKPDEQVQK